MPNGKNVRELATIASNVRELYDKYSGMLLGFITQSIDDKSQAETQMIKVFKELAKAELKQTSPTKFIVINCWNDLRKFALLHLSVAKNNNTIQKNLTEQQQSVFNSVYYQKKSIAAIAVQLNQTEDSIRETLKQAFAVMKSNYEN